MINSLHFDQAIVRFTANCVRCQMPDGLGIEDDNVLAYMIGFFTEASKSKKFLFCADDLMDQVMKPLEELHKSGIEVEEKQVDQAMEIFKAEMLKIHQQLVETIGRFNQQQHSRVIAVIDSSEIKHSLSQAFIYGTIEFKNWNERHEAGYSEVFPHLLSGYFDEKQWPEY